MKFDVKQDRRFLGADGKSTGHLWVSIKAPKQERAKPRSPVHVAFVLDRSGSMAGEKLGFAKEAVRQALLRLGADDRFSIVIYDDQVELLVASCNATARNREEAQRLLAGVGARSTTDLFGGWVLGCRQIAEHLGDGDTGRCLLLTDGKANEGRTDHDEILRHVQQLRERGVETSTFGVGADFEEGLLQRMATVGGGSFYFIERAEQIPDLITSEVREALGTVASDAEIVIDAPPDVTIETLHDYPVERRGRLWRVKLGTLFSEQVLNPILVVRAAEGPVRRRIPFALALADREDVLRARGQHVVFELAEDDVVAQEMPHPDVVRRVARVQAARTSAEALKANRAGDDAAAEKILQVGSRHLHEWSKGDPIATAQARRLEEQVTMHKAGMSAMQRKRLAFDSYATTSEKARYLRRKYEGIAPRVTLLPTIPALAGACDLAVRSLQWDMLPTLSVDHRIELLEAVARMKSTSIILDPASELELVHAAGRVDPDAAVRIVFTDRRHVDNWFSHWHPVERTAVISTFAWDETAMVPIASFAAYEALLFGLAALVPGLDPLSLAHEETRGCFLDLCRHKREIEIKLQTMDLCSTCEARLDAMGVPLDKLAEAREIVRTLGRR